MGFQLPSPFDNAIKDQLTDFEITDRLGGGAQGSVFRALQRSTSHRVALKLYVNPQDSGRVKREIEALENYHHPNMADLIDYGIISLDGFECPYIAWELIDGESLADRLSRGPVSPQEASALGRDISRAIYHIWQKRIVHRDIKPPNIMMRASNKEAVLIDLGVARHIDATTITSAGFFCGTPGFMSPEQARAEKNLSCLSDVFSLGIVLLSALTGVHPTRGNQQALMSSTINVSAAIPFAQSGFSDLVQRMISLRPAFRPHPLELATQFAMMAGNSNVLFRN